MLDFDGFVVREKVEVDPALGFFDVELVVAEVEVSGGCLRLTEPPGAAVVEDVNPIAELVSAVALDRVECGSNAPQVAGAQVLHAGSTETKTWGIERIKFVAFQDR